MDKKLIMFPNLETKIIENGLELFRNQKYYDAIELFEEGLELGINANLFKSALVISYIETNQLEKGKQLIIDLIKDEDENYLTHLNLAVMILVQLNEHEEIVEILEEAFNKNKISADMTEHFLGMLELSKKLTKNKSKINNKKTLAIDLFNYQTIEEQMEIVKELLTEKISPYRKEIQSYLNSEDGQLFFKTLLVMMLEDKLDSSEYTVRKLDVEMRFVPKELKTKEKQPTKEEIIKRWTNDLESQNPTYLIQLVEYVEKPYFLLYPFDFSMYDITTIMSGFEYKLLQATNTLVDINNFIESKDLNRDSFIRFLNVLNRLD